MRRAIEGAEVVTFNIGLNDLGHAGAAYEEGTCGGEDGEECLRERWRRSKTTGMR
jgi:hypothetical protein